MFSCISALALYLGLFVIVTTNVILASATKHFAPASSIGISAKEIGSARNIVTHWQTSWGSFDRDYLATRDIEIEIHNLSKLPARIAIDFYFVGRPQRLPTPHKLFSKHSFIVNVAASYQERFSLRSDVLRSRETYYATLGDRYTSGYEIEGWILFARLPGQPQPFDKVSSSKAMLEHLDWFPARSHHQRRRVPHLQHQQARRRPGGIPLPQLVAHLELAAQYGINGDRRPVCRRHRALLES